MDNQGKVSILRRVLLGLGAVGVRDVLVMPDVQRLGEQARRGLERVGWRIPAIKMLEMPVTGRAEDSERASRLLRQEGARCIVVLGGDGTVRVVSKGAGDVPLLPISTGTNNVIPRFVAGTIAGLAAGALATGQVAVERVVLRHKWLELFLNGVSRDRALIDATLLEGRFVGCRAVWRVQTIRQVVVTRADPASIGMSAIAGVVRPIAPEEPIGLALTLSADGSRRVLAVIGPGLLSEVGIGSVRTLQLGDRVDLVANQPLILALDGEREIPLREGDRVAIVLRANGPWVVDAGRVMDEMAAQRLFDRPASRELS